MKKISLYHFIFFLILFLGAFLRLHALSSVPPSPSLDEVSLGYNAYSISRTGKDEFGTTFPFILRAYDDYRPALYVYLIIPFLWLFDLSVLAVRLPSVLLSIGSLILTFQLGKIIFSKKTITFFNQKIPLTYLPFFMMFLLAISPWHIYISRLGHEVNLAFFLYLLGIVCFFMAMRGKKWFLPLSVVCFIISMYSYQSEKLLSPLTFFFLGVLFMRELFRMKKEVIVSIIVGIILLIPLVLITLTPQTFLRFQGTSAFTSDDPLYYQRSIQLLHAKESGNKIAEFFYNRRITSVIIFARNYISHFDPNWLIYNLGDENHKVPGLGLLYPWELVFLIIGMIVVIASSLKLQIKLFLFAWLFLSPLPAAITTQAPHALRTFTILPLPQLFTSLGLLTCFYLYNHKGYKRILLGFFIFLSCLSIMYFYHQYFFTFPLEESSSFQYPLVQAMQYAIGHEKSFKQIYVSNERELSQSYMRYLYITKYDPKKYLAQGGTVSGGFATVHTIGKYTFGRISFAGNKKGVLYIGNPFDFKVSKLNKKGVTPKRMFANLKGENVIYAVY